MINEQWLTDSVEELQWNGPFAGLADYDIGSILQELHSNGSNIVEGNEEASWLVVKLQRHLEAIADSGADWAQDRCVDLDRDTVRGMPEYLFKAIDWEKVYRSLAADFYIVQLSNDRIALFRNRY